MVHIFISHPTRKELLINGVLKWLGLYLGAARDTHEYKVCQELRKSFSEILDDSYNELLWESKDTLYIYNKEHKFLTLTKKLLYKEPYFYDGIDLGGDYFFEYRNKKYFKLNILDKELFYYQY